MMPIAAVPAADAPSGWTTLAGFDLLRLEGPQARHFLHGQATCDLKAAAPERLVGGACCTPKGRVVANFTLFCAAADAQTTLHLRMRATMLEALENFLTTYARFSRTQLAPLGADWRGLGVSGEALETLAKILTAPLPEPGVTAASGDCTLLRLDSSRLECWGPTQAIAELAARLKSASAPLADDDWALMSVRAGRAELEPAGGEKYLPQMLNMDLIDEVSFSKGCYTGQEVVARAQHRGEVKRRMYRLGCEAPPALGAEVRADGKAIGEVVTAGGGECLAVLSRAEAEAGALSVDEAAAAILPLPYALPTLTGAPAGV